MVHRATGRRRVAATLVTFLAASTLLVVGAPSSRASLKRVDGLATTPRNNVAAIYDEFGAQPDDTATLAAVEGALTDEGYKVKRYTDVNEGAGPRGTATLANFVGMAKQASVIVINGHGYDPAAATQSCVGGKGFTGFGAPAAPVVTVPSSNVQSCAAINQAVIQVEWYPTLADGEQARRDYVAQGYKKEWFFGPVVAPTNIDPRPGDQVPLDDNGFPAPQRGGQRPALFLTASGIAHFFSKQKLDIVDTMACQAMALAPSFNARTFFGHARTACTRKEALDERKLFERMTGHSGVEARSTTAAFAMGGFTDQYFQIASTSKPVVLSPAVSEVTPSDGGGVDGVSTPVRVVFDAKMARAAAKSVVTASGCDATVANANWASDGELSLDLKVPKIQPGKTVTLTVHQSAAKSAGGYPHALDGNQVPGDSGVAPNRDDYVWKLSCAPSSKFKMVYTGTYSFNYSQTGPRLVPTTETASYTWTQTQIVSVSAASSVTSEYVETTSLDASGSSTLEGPGLSVTCTIQTPQSYQWVARTVGRKFVDKSDSPVSFLWSISTPPPPGTAGATGSAGNGPPSGCQSNLLGFRAELGIPEPTPNGERTTLDGSQMQTFLDAESGSLAVPNNQLPKTKNFDIDAQKTTTEDTVTNAGSMKLHGTLTFSRVS